ncbi:MAG: hypothetical protein EZS28_047972, partial [Streblomastix strix]
LQKSSLVLITSLILCMLSVHLFIGMLVKVWKKENSQKLVKILLHLRKITKKLEPNLVVVRKKRKRKLDLDLRYNISNLECADEKQSFIISHSIIILLFFTS